MNAVSHLSSTSTGNTLLAAALTAIGIPLAQKPFVRVVGDGVSGERMIWFFEPRSHDGSHLTKDLIEAWHSEGWHLANPEHPFAYIKCALLNRECLVDKVKQDAPLACIQRRGKIALISLDASPRTEEFILRHL
jgi:hypothetical protein